MLESSLVMGRRVGLAYMYLTCGNCVAGVMVLIFKYKVGQRSLFGVG